jgi:hypothetical protein
MATHCDADAQATELNKASGLAAAWAGGCASVAVHDDPDHLSSSACK